MGGRRQRNARRASVVAVALAGVLLSGSGPSGATPGDPPATPMVAVRVEARLDRIARVTGGTALAQRPGDPTLYVARQQGQVVPISRGRARDPILDVADRIGSHREQGLLGLTFSPGGHRMYVYFTSTAGANTLEEYRVTRAGRPPVRVDIASRRALLEVPHEKPTHNGGHLAFGPDGMLYVSMGDGGGHRGMGPGQVPGGNSQSLDNLLGKILRIDPEPSADRPYTVPADNPFAAGGGAPEILHYGLRNPWRFSFDRGTGDLWIGDVGQDHWEEIDVAPAGSRALNFGYPLLEGHRPLQALEAPGTIAPVHVLWHRSGNCAITGGSVYRGRALRALRGHYVFTDYCRGRLKAVRVEEGGVVGRARLRLTAPLVSSFAESADGELLVLSQAKGVLRLVPR